MCRSPGSSLCWYRRLLGFSCRNTCGSVSPVARAQGDPVPLSSASSPLLPPWNQPLVLCRPAQAAEPMGNPPGKKPQKSVFSWISSPSHGNAHCQDKGWGRTGPGAWQQQQTSQVLLSWEQDHLSIRTLTISQKHFIFSARSKNGWGAVPWQESVRELNRRDTLGGGNVRSQCWCNFKLLFESSAQGPV